MAELALAVAPIAYKALVGAWGALDDALSFSEDTEDLLLRLEILRAHLSIWASSSKLSNGTLLPSLLPFDEPIAKTLNRIRKLVSDADQVGKEYGLVWEERGESKQGGAIIRMCRSLQAALANSKTKSKLGELLEHEVSRQETLERNETTVSKRLSWAIRDKKKFKRFVGILETHVDGLHKLLLESERKEVQREETRFGLQVIQGLSDMESLSHLQNAPGWYQGSSEIDVSCLAQWKAITLNSASTDGLGLLRGDGLNLASLSPSDRMKVRFIKRGQVDYDSCYLFEKKEYDMNITDIDKDLLKERIRKLISLLSGTRAQVHLHTLQAVDYMDDPGFHCWWIIFRFPLLIIGTFPSDSEPLSLRKLYTSPWKPPLEQRYALAKRLAGTFEKLYGSNWMHKSINSNNIIFPQLSNPEFIRSFRSLNSALIQGFGYSRQHTETQTIDRGKVLGDLESAIYRHPNYQGEAASGYKIHYDIYSLGLVFLELGIWAPLMDFLAAIPRVKPPVDLSPTMVHFHHLEAEELQRRVDIRVEHDLPYRVGTKYTEVVRWCLNLKGPVTPIEFYNAVSIPLGELCS
ncbi:uncharacterized protein BDR25DRAFT_306870 [Lindgomyces ingoldianus]|uniref:Uncharacterized protein n=1 Tax=Lindgomyces ingoldianus TaxID=673940 RepID=A0ACB6QFU8_9PLEO|nr:uncharacterized protein BDR25DRAFT_306870 [Lindgomyces ingoldianus]KAF2465006.1 hypothetical protein BDR25DRAFT_306870 [Lindgomyces ingoldianus]